MNSLDPIILAIFLLVVAYMVKRAIDSLDDQVKVEFKGITFEPKAPLEERIDNVPLENIVGARIKFEQRYKFNLEKGSSDIPKLIKVTLENKSDYITIRVDWDNSNLTDYKKSARRAIRLFDDRVEDVTRAQIKTLIPPKFSITETVTAEPVLKEKADTDWRPEIPLIDLVALRKESKATSNKPDEKKRIALRKQQITRFMESKIPIRFTLRLLLQFTDISAGVKKDYYCFMLCNFTIRRLEWLDQLPWNPKPKD